MAAPAELTAHDQMISAVQAEAEALLADRQPVRVLDAGCGARSKLQFPEGFVVTGIDTSEQQLARNTRVDHKVVGDLQTHQFGADSFDLITCWNVLEHLPEPTSALDRMREALSPGGLLIVASPNIWSVRTMVTRLTPHRFHVWFYRKVLDKPDAGTGDVAPFPTVLSGEMSPAGIRRYAAANGLEIVRLDTYEPNQTLKARRKSPALGWALDAAGGVSKLATRGRVDARESEYIALLRRPYDGAASTPS